MVTDIQAIRSVIDSFLAERLQPKLDKLKDGDEEQRQKLIQEHQPDHWIANAARRAGQIQRVTHAIKYSHPDARGSSLFSRGAQQAPPHLVDTHSLSVPAADVVGNAAALDVYKFLRLEVQGQTLLELAQADVPVLHEAFGGGEPASDWIRAFAALDQADGRPASHPLARQLYWPLNGDGYHLLAPLFPTSLAQAQYERLREARFSEATRAAREARRKGEPHAAGFRNFPNLAIMHFGGTKPQNISQLNSERRGEAWLLAALPPDWKPQGLKPPCHVESVFGRWLMDASSVRDATATLSKFLQNTAHNNADIRRKRAFLTAQLIDEVLFLTARIRDLPAGWSAEPGCRLCLAEALWLDPGRARIDSDFASARGKIDWKEQVPEAFSRWLNARLDSERTPMSDDERQHWKNSLKDEMRLLREELDHA